MRPPSSSPFAPGNNPLPPRGGPAFVPGSALSGRNTIAAFLAYVFAPPRDDPAFNERAADDWSVVGSKLDNETFRTE